jgi:hypothetical protein
MDPRDLRLKLQRRSSQPSFAGTKSSGVRELREKLSGMMHPQPRNVDPPKPKPGSEVVKTTRPENTVEVPVRQSKKPSKQTSSKVSQPKVCTLHVMNAVKYMLSCFPYYTLIPCLKARKTIAKSNVYWAQHQRIDFFLLG